MSEEAKSSQSSNTDSEFGGSEGGVSSDEGEYTDIPILVDQGHQ